MPSVSLPKSLRLAAREQDRAVLARNEVRDDRDLANVLDAAAVEALALKDHLAFTRRDQLVELGLHGLRER